MGTSSSNRGPQRRSPLLPDWYDPADGPQLPPPEREDTENSEKKPDEKKPESVEQQEPAESRSGNWGAGKGALTRMANGTSGASIRKSGKSYVRSIGGARSATKAAAVGISTGAKFTSFWSGVARNGFEQTAGKLGLTDLVGKSSEEILASIADLMAPPGTTNDEAIAREAVITTLEYLYEKLAEDGRDITDIQQLDAETLKEIVIEYASNFVFTKWMHELGIAIEKGNVSVQDAVKLEAEIKEYVKEEVRSCYGDKEIRDINLNEDANRAMLTEILLNTYQILEK